MKDEIKEILEALRDSIDDTGTDKVNFINWVDKIENYITTLQERINNQEFLLKEQGKELKELYARIDKTIDKLSERMAFTSSYQLNYQSAMYVIEEAKKILLQGDDK